MASLRLASGVLRTALARLGQDPDLVQRESLMTESRAHLLAALHLVSLLLDTTARIGLLDIVLPFHSSYGTLAIGLGALSVDVLVVVTVTAYLKRRMRKDLWLWIHRLAYAAFALIFLHAVLSGTDFSDPAVSAITWGSAAALLTLGLARLLGGRLPA